jgi:peptide/nickel transport system permease protein
VAERILEDRDESYYFASQWELMGRKFRKHKLAVIGVVVLAVLYFLALFCEFCSPYAPSTRSSSNLYAPPQRVRFVDDEGFHLRPFVYAWKNSLDPKTFQRRYVVDGARKLPIRFFVHGDAYKLWGLFRMDLHLFGVADGNIFVFGADDLGRDMLSRTLYGARISLSVGLVGVALSFVLGCILGGISGFYGGRIDTVIQRVIEFLTSIPHLPLWMALSAALPPRWPPVKVYFGITIILSIVGWCGLARVVRGKLLELREEDFVMAAKIAGVRERTIIRRHLLPSFFSYLVVNLTLSIPNMILGETSLSFLGLGIRPPAVSWGTLLQDSQNVRTVILHFWLFIPVGFVILTVLAFNFVGDGLRDAADPYK